MKRGTDLCPWHLPLSSLPLWFQSPSVEEPAEEPPPAESASWAPQPIVPASSEIQKVLQLPATSALSTDDWLKAVTPFHDQRANFHKPGCVGLAPAHGEPPPTALAVTTVTTQRSSCCDCETSCPQMQRHRKSRLLVDSGLDIQRTERTACVCSMKPGLQLEGIKV